MVLAILVLLSITSLMIVNYFTVKTLSATRAFVSGESIFSKAEKDGSRHLQMYLKSHDERYFNLYRYDAELIIADSMALHGLLHHASETVINKYLMQAGNNADDNYDVIWLCTNFKDVPFLKQNILIWQHANTLTGTVYLRALQIHKEIQQGSYSREKSIADIDFLNKMSDQLTVVERLFTDKMNGGSRNVRRLLLLGEYAMIIIIILFNCLYAWIAISRLLRSAALLKVNNAILDEANSELDRFIYSASHELRSPVTSLLGLLAVVREADSNEDIGRNLALMDETLELQDTFIQEIVNYFRNKRTLLQTDCFNIRSLATRIFQEHAHACQDDHILFSISCEPDLIFSDLTRIDIILNGLISNAVKFRDKQRPECTIAVKCNTSPVSLTIQVSDNGIGIDEKFQPRIFEMLFVTLHPRRGSGLGLYVVSETVAKMGGRIELKSAVGAGTCITIILPVI